MNPTTQFIMRVLIVLHFAFFVIGSRPLYASPSSNRLSQTQPDEMAQPLTFAKTIVHPSADGISNLIILPNDEIFVLGASIGRTSGQDIWVAKLNRRGKILTERSINTRFPDNGSFDDSPENIYRTSDGGYLIVGGLHQTNYYDGGVMKLNADALPVWQRLFGSYDANDDAWFHSAIEVQDGYLIAGTRSKDDFNSVESNLWLVKLDFNGAEVWNKRFAYASYFEAPLIQKTMDGGFLVVDSAYAENSDTSVVGLKFDSNGSIVWQKRYGTDKLELVKSVTALADGGFVLVGSAWYSTLPDAWVLKLDNDGTIVWQYRYGGPKSDHADRIIAVSDGFLIVGLTTSFGAGKADAWLFKLSPSGELEWQRTYGGKKDDLFTAVATDSGGNIIMGGTTESFGNGDQDIWIVKSDPLGRLGANCAQGKKSKAVREATNAQTTDQNFAEDSPIAAYLILHARVKDTSSQIATQCIFNP